MPRSILIVDDSQAVRHLVRSYLESQLDQVACTEAVNGRDAIERVRNAKPDVIVLDVSMPIMNGLAAAPFLHDMAPLAPIILFTLHKDVVSEKQAVAVGIRAVVSKMDEVEVLLKSILKLTAIVRSTMPS
ncbi:MAG TPA: response regulator [Candidatus Acidoferrales bacterium]|nr:response regulator [Candidatus Acidoferrales bacterium]